MTRVLLDGGWRTTKEAEHALHEIAARLGLRPVTACTHFASGPPRVVVSLELEEPVPPALAAEAARSVSSVDAGAGRAFVFPGSAGLTGEVRVGDLLATTAIDEIRRLGGLPVDPDARLDTQNFVRPVVHDGRLVLMTRPARGDRLIPFEQPNPTPCCASH